MKAKYEVGDRVCLAGRPDRVGVVLTEPQERRGTFYYQVFFDASDKDTQL